MLQADLSSGSQNLGDSNETVSGRCEDEAPFNQVATMVPGLAEATNGFEPTERLLDLFAPDHADATARWRVLRIDDWCCFGLHEA
jgi:hypothetical protein